MPTLPGVGIVRIGDVIRPVVFVSSSSTVRTVFLELIPHLLVSILPIYTYDHPILRKRLAPVAEFNEELRQLIADMIETMYNAEGIGLAANQVGRDMAMTVIDISGNEEEREKGIESKPLVLINPVIEAYSDEEESSEEGCLSLPDLRADVVRSKGVQVRYIDPDMKEITMEADGLLARVIQHEVDHLHGRYFIERLSSIRRTMLRRHLLEIKRGEMEADYPLYTGE